MARASTAFASTAFASTAFITKNVCTRRWATARWPFADGRADLQPFARVALASQPDLVEQLELSMRSE
jgi:hypothetical protein